MKYWKIFGSINTKGGRLSIRTIMLKKYLKMIDMEWSDIKRGIYYTDNGKFRNICTSEMQLSDWEKWINLINREYEVAFINNRTKEKRESISIVDVMSFWEGKNEDGYMASVFVEGIQFNCFFNEVVEFENDIDAFQIVNLRHHDITIEYIKKISKLLDKVMTLERDFLEPEPRILLKVYHDEVYYLFS